MWTRFSVSSGSAPPTHSVSPSPLPADSRYQTIKRRFGCTDDTEGFLAKTLAYMESYPPQRIDAMRETHYAKYLSGAALARHSDGEASTRDSIHSEHADTICDADSRPDEEESESEAREVAAAERLHQMERVIASARSAACASQRTAEGARGQRRAAEELLEQREAALFAAQAEREAAAEVSRNAPVRNRFKAAD